MSEHANGALSCIARSLGGDEPDDFWYEQGKQLLEDLAAAGFVIGREHR